MKAKTIQESKVITAHEAVSPVVPKTPEEGRRYRDGKQRSLERRRDAEDQG